MNRGGTGKGLGKAPPPSATASDSRAEGPTVASGSERLYDTIREAISASPVIPVGEEPFVGWSFVLTDHIMEALAEGGDQAQTKPEWAESINQKDRK